jgi:hypothetical protein
LTATGWWNDPVVFRAKLDEHEGRIGRLSLATGVPRTTLSSAKERHTLAGDEVEITSEDLADLDQMIRERGLVPDDWFVRDVIVNTWTSADGSLARQLKAFLKRKVTFDLLVPAVDIRPIAPPKKPDPTQPRLVVFVGDEQEPYSDPVLKELFLRWLAHNRPDVGDDGAYEHSEVEIAENLVARHGWITGANSAAKTLAKIGCDVVVGHTHRQQITWMTETRRGETLTTQAVEAGCMCQIKGGLGYTVSPQWQNGWATAVVWPDGSHVIELASYVDGAVRWRDQRYSSDEALRSVA